MIFVHSSLMLRDIPTMALGFLGLYLYFKNKYYFAALVIGLAALIKETAIFFMVFIMIWSVVKFVQNNDVNYRNFIVHITLNGKSRIAFRKSIIFVGIVSGVFLGSLFVYENTITVLEYEFIFPEYYVENSNRERVSPLELHTTPDFMFEKSVNDFYYIDKVKNPIHHLNLFFTKGYYTGIENIVENEFVSSFLPIAPVEIIIRNIIDEKKILDNDVTIIWIQSVVNYSYWHIAFYGILLLISYAIYDKVRNQKSISNQTLFLILGLVFFVPFLIIDQIRATYAYYILPYLPFMALGLILVIYKIQNKKIRTMVLSSFFLAIIVNFIYYFPIKLL